jgi:hypothetical protein
VIKSVDKRLNKLESVTPDKEIMKGLGELYEWENTPEGKAELNKLYNPDRCESE